MSLPLKSPIINMEGIKVITEEDEEYAETPISHKKLNSLKFTQEVNFIRHL